MGASGARRQSPLMGGQIRKNSSKKLGSVFFLSRYANRGHTGGGRTLGIFFVLAFLNAPPPPAVFASIFHREKDSAVPSLVDNDVEL